MNLLLRPLATTFALVLTASAAFAAEGITLKQQWQTGKRYTQTMKMEQATTITMGEMKMEQKMSMDAEMSSAVTKHEDGKSKRIAVKYERMVLDTEMAGQKMHLDSSKPDEATGPMGNPFAGFTGKEIRLVVDENDKVKDFENFDEIAKAAGNSNPITASFLNKDALSRSIQQSALQALPTHPVKPGDTWTFSVDLPLPQMGKGVAKGTYTFKGVTPHGGVPCAEITVDGTISFDMNLAETGADAKASPMAGLGMKIENGTMKGTVWFDNALGMSRGSEMHQDMDLSMKNPGKPEEMMKMPMKQTVTTTLTKVEDVK